MVFFPQDLQLILIAWLSVGSMLVGIGALLRRAGGTRLEGADGIFRDFWVGFMATLFALESWHLVFAIDDRIFMITAGLGAAGLLLGASDIYRGVRGHLLRNVPPIALSGVAAVTVAHIALGGARHGDTGAYFLASIDWARSYPAVPGLGNLSTTLGFNQSFFLYAAWLDVGPFTDRARHIANGLPLLALGSRSLLGLWRILLSRSPLGPQDLFYGLMLPACVAFAGGPFVSSPSPDLLIFVLGVVLAGEALPFFTRQPDADHSPGVFEVVVIALLAAGGVTTKQSFGALGAATGVLVGLAWLVKRPNDRLLDLARLLAIGAGVIIYVSPWVAHSVISTGFPFYPSSFGAVPVDWQVQVDWDTWSRQVMQLDYAFLLRDPSWAMQRLNSLGWGHRDAVWPLSVALIAAGLGIVRVLVDLVRHRPLRGRVSMLILLPTLVSFAFCFATAPMARYFGAIFWLLAVQTTLLALGPSVYDVGRMLPRTLLALAVVAGCVATFLPARAQWRLYKNFVGTPRVALKEIELATGLEVFVPEQGCSCWTSPLLCTPIPNQALRLRREGDLSAGFRIDPDIAWARHPEGDARCQMGEQRKAQSR